MENKQNANVNANSNSTPIQKDKSFKSKVGDVIEKVGHKISDAGAPKIGQKIHDLGDTLEKTHQNPSHPHKV
ncbi:MAG: hypothetical protein H7061_05190 [Bdellovibrionaceae bacterium]|nr:hypothetical protein [Bdellovibrio sp.]